VRIARPLLVTSAGRASPGARPDSLIARPLPGRSGLPGGDAPDLVKQRKLLIGSGPAAEIRPKKAFAAPTDRPSGCTPHREVHPPRPIPRRAEFGRYELPLNNAAFNTPAFGARRVPTALTPRPIPACTSSTALELSVICSPRSAGGPPRPDYRRARRCCSPWTCLSGCWRSEAGDSAFSRAR